KAPCELAEGGSAACMDQTDVSSTRRAEILSFVSIGLTVIGLMQTSKANVLFLFLLHRHSRIRCGMWSFWTAFEHGFDENELKCAQTRTILTKTRIKLTASDRFEPRVSWRFCIFDPLPPPPLFSSTSTPPWKTRRF